VLARFHQVDPLAAKYASLSPYNYAFNNPVSLNDPTGADPALNNPGSWVYYTDHNSRDAGFWYKDRGGWQSSGVNQRHVYGREYGVFNGTRYAEAWAQAVYMAQMHQDSRNMSAADYGAKYGQSVDGFFVNKNYWDGNDLVVMPLEWVRLGLGQGDPLIQKDLIDFVSKNPFYSKYPAEWILDSKGVKTSERNPGKTIPTLKRNSEGKLYVSKIQVYIHPSAFGAITDFRQTLITGHEFIHVMHLSSGSYLRWLDSYGWSGAEAISEYWAYKWQVDNEVRLGHPLGGQAGLDKWTKLLPAGYTPR
jgi:hypothetical protein